MPGKLDGFASGVDFVFAPSKIKKSFALRGTVDVTAAACLDCGAVEMRIDPATLLELSGEPDPRGPGAT